MNEGEREREREGKGRKKINESKTLQFTQY